MRARIQIVSLERVEGRRAGTPTSEDVADAVLVGALGRRLVPRLERVRRERHQPVEHTGHGAAKQRRQRVQLAVRWRSSPAPPHVRMARPVNHEGPGRPRKVGGRLLCRKEARTRCQRLLRVLVGSKVRVAARHITQERCARALAAGPSRGRVGQRPGGSASQSASCNAGRTATSRAPTL